MRLHKLYYQCPVEPALCRKPPSGQATISITMSVPFAPERLTCTLLPDTERRVVKRINHNTKKNPKT